jgi:hypothetical protein
MKVVLETLRLFSASSDTFGEDLVKGIEASQKKEPMLIELIFR